MNYSSKIYRRASEPKRLTSRNHASFKIDWIQVCHLAGLLFKINIIKFTKLLYSSHIWNWRQKLLNCFHRWSMIFQPCFRERFISLTKSLVKWNLVNTFQMKLLIAFLYSWIGWLWCPSLDMIFSFFCTGKNVVMKFYCIWST